MLGWMEYRLQQGKMSEEVWGGIPVVVFLGDDIQLPPVCDAPVYMGNAKSAAGLHGTIVWNSFNNVIKLSTVVRQREDQQMFKDVLTSLRNSTTTKDQAEWLQRFQWDQLRVSHGTELLQDMARTGLFVFPTHDLEWQHNKSKLVELNQNHPIAKVSAENRGLHANSASSEMSGGLAKETYLCKGARVMLTVNINVNYGLYNGAVGEILDILYPEGCTPTDCQPSVVVVNFPKYTGPSFIPDSPTLVPIHAVDHHLNCDCCVRKQVPLRPGWGTTIHKCQGMTIGHGELNKYVIVHPGNKSFESRTPGALYVALSRAKSAGGIGENPEFAFHGDILLNPDRVCHVVNTPTVRARSKEIKRLDALATKTRHVNPQLDEEATFNNILTAVLNNTSYSTEE